MDRNKLFESEEKNPMGIEPFTFLRERTGKLENNVNLLNMLDSKRVLFYGNSSNLDQISEIFVNSEINEEEISNLSYRDFKNYLNFSQVSIELYGFLQASQNEEVNKKYIQHQTNSSLVHFFC